MAITGDVSPEAHGDDTGTVIDRPLGTVEDSAEVAGSFTVENFRPDQVCSRRNAQGHIVLLAVAIDRDRAACRRAGAVSAVAVVVVGRGVVTVDEVSEFGDTVAERGVVTVDAGIDDGYRHAFTGGPVLPDGWGLDEVHAPDGGIPEL
ncbi:hypothetical protein DSECCO2_596810 [anaerobic digester metagenome]